MDEKCVARFIGRFNAATTRLPSGAVKIHTDDLRRLVREEADLAPMVVARYLEAAGSARDRGLFQRATLLADAYLAETGDGSLLARCKEAAWACDIGVSFGFEPDRNDLPILLPVNAKELEDGDASSFLRVFSVERAGDVRRRELARMAGRCVLELPFDDDPRPVAHIPQARRWVAALHAELPYFPYFLGVDSPERLFLGYFACLAAKDATTVLASGKIDLSLDHPSVTPIVLESLVAVHRVSGLLQQEPDDAVDRLLYPFPHDMRLAFLASLFDLVS